MKHAIALAIALALAAIRYGRANVRTPHVVAVESPAIAGLLRQPNGRVGGWER